MLKPHAVEPGARIAVVAPASPFAREEFDSGIAEIRRLGFEPTYDESVFARRGYLAGDARVRVEAIRAAWRDHTVGAIMGVRGGYGSMQLLPLLDAAEARAARKAFIGYSDLTAMLTFLTGACGLVAFHGPMLAGRLARGEPGYDRASLLGALGRREPLGSLAPAGVEVIRRGEAAGPLFGGNLAQLVASLGTPFRFDPPQGCVLFLEEVGERPYRLDRMMLQLRLAGLLARASAIVVGQLKDCDEPAGAPTARSVMADLLADFPGPVIIGFPSGHTSGATLTLPLGVRCRVVAAAGTPAVVIEEAAVD
jgi:muramoyltetrapeptide carboxypeptidase